MGIKIGGPCKRSLIKCGGDIVAREAVVAVTLALSGEEFDAFMITEPSTRRGSTVNATKASNILQRDFL